MASRWRIGWDALRDSLWFLPSLIVLAFAALAVGLIELDSRIAAEALRPYPRLFGAGAEGTRGMLEAIASAMITVAGIAFSITIVALSLTSSQYSPRVLRNFMGDRSNQTVLGTFVGLHAYCLIVLRTIRGGDADPFVPSIATLAAIVLAFLGIALLIHFIHHVSSSIQAAQIVAAIHDETSGAIDRLYPERLGERREGPGPMLAAALRRGAWQAVAAGRSGYVQGVDADAILRLAVEHDAVVHLACRIGDFVVEGHALARVHFHGKPADEPLPLAGSIAIGVQRTVRQDAAFGLRQLVDVALKALSPGINDATTAIMCLDRLSSLLVRLAGRRMPSPFRGAGGVTRVVAPTWTYADLLALALEEIRLAAAAQPVVLARLLAVLEGLLHAEGALAHRPAIFAMLARVARSVDALDDGLQRQELATRIALIRSNATEQAAEALAS